MTTPEQRLKALGYELGNAPAPAANYVPVTRIGDTLFISGQISQGPNGIISGTLGGDMDVAAGQAAAARCAVSLLSQIVGAGGIGLAHVRMVKLTVLVASVPEFTNQHLVANGASDLLVEVLGENGRHARAAFGVVSLPRGAAVEVEAVAAVIA